MMNFFKDLRMNACSYCFERSAKHSENMAEVSGGKNPKVWNREMKATFGWLRLALLFGNKDFCEYIRKSMEEQINYYQK